MDYLMALVTTGVIMGFIYALMALGLTLIFSILNVINFAHGEFYMLGGYFSYYLLTWFTDLNPFVAVMISGLLVFAIGILFELLFLRPMHLGKIERPPEYAVLITFGLSFLFNIDLQLFKLFADQPKKPYCQGC